MRFSDIEIGSTFPVEVIAELSANHMQSLELAKQTIYAISKTGVRFIKFQTYTPDSLTLKSKKKYFKIDLGSPWDSRYLYDLYSEAFMPWDWHAELFSFAKSLYMIPFSSPFDEKAVDFLENLDVPMYKIASYEITDIPLIKYVAKKGKPIILSSGISEIQDLKLAIDACKDEGNHEILILKCTSSYPTHARDVNLRQLSLIQETFGTEIGLSDHTLTNRAALGAVALGASVVEKHVILDRSISGPDSSFSITPEELSILVSEIRELEMTLGSREPELPESVKRARTHARSLFVTKNVVKGETVSEENIRSVRPANGLHPRFKFEVMGRKFSRDVDEHEPLSLDMID